MPILTEACYMYVYPSIYLSIYLSIYIYIHLSINSNIYIIIYISIDLSKRPTFVWYKTTPLIIPNTHKYVLQMQQYIRFTYLATLMSLKGVFNADFHSSFPLLKTPQIILNNQGVKKICVKYHIVLQGSKIHKPNS